MPSISALNSLAAVAAPSPDRACAASPATTSLDALIPRAAAGDSEAQSLIAKAIRPEIERQLTRYPVSEDDRRDLAQIALMQIMRRLGSFRGDSSFSTWVFRVTANEALMLLRSQRRHRARILEGVELDDLRGADSAQGGPREATSEGCDVAYATKERDVLLRNTLAELPEEYRNVVVAHYHLDLGLQEIADRFELTESAVRSRLHRARICLREMLDRRGLTFQDGLTSFQAA